MLLDFIAAIPPRKLQRHSATRTGNSHACLSGFLSLDPGENHRSICASRCGRSLLRAAFPARGCFNDERLTWLKTRTSNYYTRIIRSRYFDRQAAAIRALFNREGYGSAKACSVPSSDVSATRFRSPRPASILRLMGSSEILCVTSARRFTTNPSGLINASATASGSLPKVHIHRVKGCPLGNPEANRL
jgi:hypothetical protein